MKITYNPLLKFACKECEDAEFTLKEDVWLNPYCPYCGHAEATYKFYGKGDVNNDNK